MLKYKIFKCLIIFKRRQLKHSIRLKINRLIKPIINCKNNRNQKRKKTKKKKDRYQLEKRILKVLKGKVRRTRRTRLRKVKRFKKPKKLINSLKAIRQNSTTKAKKM